MKSTRQYYDSTVPIIGMNGGLYYPLISVSLVPAEVVQPSQPVWTPPSLNVNSTSGQTVVRQLKETVAEKKKVLKTMKKNRRLQTKGLKKLTQLISTRQEEYFNAQKERQDILLKLAELPEAATKQLDCERKLSKIEAKNKILRSEIETLENELDIAKQQEKSLLARREKLQATYHTLFLKEEKIKKETVIFPQEKNDRLEAHLNNKISREEAQIKKNHSRDLQKKSNQENLLKQLENIKIAHENSTEEIMTLQKELERKQCAQPQPTIEQIAIQIEQAEKIQSQLNQKYQELQATYQRIKNNIDSIRKENQSFQEKNTLLQKNINAAYSKNEQLQKTVANAAQANHAPQQTQPHISQRLFSHSGLEITQKMAHKKLPAETQQIYYQPFYYQP